MLAFAVHFAENSRWQCIAMRGQQQDIGLQILEADLQKALAVAETAGLWIPGGRMPFEAKTLLAIDNVRVSKVKGPILIPLDLIIVSPALQEFWMIKSKFFGSLRCHVVSRN